MSDLVTRDLAKALGLPGNTRRAVLTLEVGQLPRLEIETLPSVQPQRLGDVLDPRAVAAVPFVTRLQLWPSRFRT